MNDQINEYLVHFPAWIQIMILLLGAYSITRLIVTDTFPVFEKSRNWIFERFPHDGYATKKKPTRGKTHMISNGVWVVDEGHWLGNLISCPWCSGWWVGVGVFVASVVAWSWTVFVLFPFAIRAFVGGFANKIGGG